MIRVDERRLTPLGAQDGIDELLRGVGHVREDRGSFIVPKAVTELRAKVP